MIENTFLRFYRENIPPVTRAILTGTVLVSTAPLLGLVSPYTIINSWPLTLRGQFWRPFTAFLYGGSGMRLFFSLFFLYQQSSELENSMPSSDYAMFTGFTASVILVSSYFSHFFFCFPVPLFKALVYLLLWFNKSYEKRI